MPSSISPPISLTATNNAVQVIFGGHLIASSTSPMLAWFASNKPPQYLLPYESLTNPLEISKETLHDDGGLGHTEIAKDSAEDQIEVESLVLKAKNGKTTTLSHYLSGDIKGLVGFPFYEQDAWIENGSLRLIPPKNPAKRIETATRTGEFVVSIGSKTIAHAREAVILFETGRPVKYYLPADSVVAWDTLKRNDVRTSCPYKGEAGYFDIELDGKEYKNAVWYYPYPIAESAAIAGRLAFDTNQDGVELRLDGQVID